MLDHKFEKSFFFNISGIEYSFADKVTYSEWLRYLKISWNSQSWDYMYTVECRYNTVQYNMILYTSLRWLEQNINVSLNPQKTPHNSP